MLNPKDAIALTQALIRCPSVTPEEGGALQLLHGILQQAGFESHIVRFSDTNTPDVDNLYARIGSGAPCSGSMPSPVLYSGQRSLRNDSMT